MQSIANRCSRVLLVSLSPLLLVSPSPARADIFQWEYIDPADPSQGKRQSATLAPDGAGVDAVPGADLSYRNLTMAYLIGADLTGADGTFANLTNADLSQANLTDASLWGAGLMGADFTNAQVRGASLRDVTFYGFTATQLYSTASYQVRDLSGIGLMRNNLYGWNFAGQNLTNAIFFGATLTNADFTGANVRGASFDIREFFSPNPVYGTGLTLAQLSSTASYQAHDLSGVSLAGSNLAGSNFAGLNFTNADLGGTNLMGASLRDANLANVEFFTSFYTCVPGVFCYMDSYSAVVTDANLTSADARGASGLSVSNATTTNLIWPDGHIGGLDLDAGALLTVRDYDGDTRYEPALPPIPITIDQHLAMGPGGTLRMVFEADAWDSTISFATGIPVTLGGTLELTFADRRESRQPARPHAPTSSTGPASLPPAPSPSPARTPGIYRTSTPPAR